MYAHTPSYRKSLPNLHVTSLMQDVQGFMWIATTKGLHKFDGSGYYSYYADRHDPFSLPSDNIISLYKDKQQRLWVSGINGICRYDALQDRFVRYGTHAPAEVWIYGLVQQQDRLLAYGQGGIYRVDEAGHRLCPLLKMNEETVLHLSVDNHGRMWCVCTGGIVACVDQKMNLLHKVSFGQRNEVYCVYTGCQDECILLGTKNGLLMLDGRTYAVLPEAYSAGQSRIPITCIREYGKGRVLLGTQSQGILVYDTAAQRILPFEGRHHIESKEITCFFVDASGNLWVGTFNKGFYLFDGYEEAFNRDKTLVSLLAGKFVTRIQEDTYGHLWIGTRYDGLFRYDPLSGKVRVFDSDSTPFLRRFANDFVQELFIDTDGRLWMCYENSLLVCRIDEGNLRLLKEFGNVGNVVTLAEDARGRVWAGNSLTGIDIYSSDLADVKHLKPVVGVNNITAIIPYDADHMLFAAYGNNLYLMETNSGKITLLDARYRECWKDAITLMRGAEGYLWIGTYGNGMFCYKPSSRNLVAYKEQKGLESNDIIGLLQDADGKLWMSSSYGIYALDPATGKVKTYLREDGTGGDQMHEKCCYRREDGTLFFGGNHGITEILPEAIPVAPTKIPVYLTDLKLFNQSVSVGGKDAVLHQALSYTRCITLAHNRNVFTLDFIGLAYDCPAQLKYAYCLKGFDRGWNEVGSYNRAAYSNLPAGNYSFEVKVLNRDGVWTAPVHLLDIRILPSPWLHPLAVGGYALLAVCVVFCIIRISVRLKLGKERYVMAQKEIARERGLARVKMNFFTNISHEIRTPLTMICSPVKMLVDLPKLKEDKEVADYLELIGSNAERLMRLVDQLLDFEKVKNDTLELRVGRHDCLLQLQTLIKLYRLYVAERNISIALECPYETLWLTYDADKLDKIMNNLLFNATKYTPQGGHIFVKVNLLKHPSGFPYVSESDVTFLQVQIIDDGVGLGGEPSGLFSRFHRLKRWIKGRTVKGSGIGLDYVKHLVENHKGMIKAENGHETGSVFTFILPVDDKEYDAQEHEEDTYISGKAEESKTLSASMDEEEEVSVLVVEDETDVRHFIRHLLEQNHYRAMEAVDGMDGLQKAMASMPDLIITDVLMPRMDGYELCGNVKSSKDLCHIPVILLTAKTLDENHLKGYAQGADLYLNKPFNPSVLLSAVDSIIRNRRRMAEQLAGRVGKKTAEAVALEEADTELNPLDKRFLDKLNAYIAEHVSDCELNVNLLGRELGFSRTNFYRKVKALTGMSPADFLRMYRLNHAIRLMEQGIYTLGEISEMVGFGTPSYFSAAFKKVFGILPREYLKMPPVKKNH